MKYGIIPRNTQVDNVTLETNQEGQLQIKKPYDNYSEVLIDETFISSKIFDLTTLSNKNFTSLKLLMKHTGDLTSNSIIKINDIQVINNDTNNNIFFLDIELLNGEIFIKGYAKSKILSLNGVADVNLCQFFGTDQTNFNKLEVIHNLATINIKLIGYYN